MITCGYEGENEQRRKAKITQGLVVVVVNFKLVRDVFYPPICYHPYYVTRGSLNIIESYTFAM